MLDPRRILRPPRRGTNARPDALLLSEKTVMRCGCLLPQVMISEAFAELLHGQCDITRSRHGRILLLTLQRHFTALASFHDALSRSS